LELEHAVLLHAPATADHDRANHLDSNGEAVSVGALLLTWSLCESGPAGAREHRRPTL